MPHLRAPFWRLTHTEFLYFFTVASHVDGSEKTSQCEHRPTSEAINTSILPLE
jgi:hypothetical protein